MNGRPLPNVCYAVFMMDAYKHRRHAVYALNYHFVWIPRRRRRVLVADVATRLDALIREKAEEVEMEILELAIQPDHLHLFVSASPDWAPNQIVHRLKGYTARALRQEFPILLRMPSMWTDAYFVSTAGRVSAETIQRYIAAQSTRA